MRLSGKNRPFGGLFTLRLWSEEMCQTGKCPYEDYIGDCQLQRDLGKTPEDAFCYDEPMYGSPWRDQLKVEKPVIKKGRYRILDLT